MFMAAASLVLALATPLQTAPAQTPAAQTQPSPLVEELWAAARAGDVERVRKALDAGAPIDAGNRYQATALMFAADKGHLDVMRLLIERGADVNRRDTFYGTRPVNWAMSNNHYPAVALLLEKGSEGAGQVLGMAAQQGNLELVRIATAAKTLTRGEVQTALAAARRGKNAEITALIEKRLADMPTTGVVTVDAATLKSYAGAYRNETAGNVFTVVLTGDQLTLVTNPAQPPLTLIPTSQTEFSIGEAQGVTLAFNGRGGLVEGMVVNQGGTTQRFARVAEGAATTAPAGSTPAAPATPTTSAPPNAPAAAPTPASKDPVKRGTPRPWAGFRGTNADGNGDGQGAIVEWDAASGKNVKWKTPIPGFTTASPIVWGNKVFTVTAISSKGDNTFRTGLYGDVKPVEDLSEHTFKIYCLDKATGKILWEQVAHVGIPKVKRHTKSAMSNSTPVTDGRTVVALFGAVGVLAGWDMNGKPLWKTDVGVLDSGWFFDPTYQWGHSSSPVIYKGSVIVQADQQKGAFIAAYDLRTGKQTWKTDRADEISTWGTPTIFSAEGRDVLVTNGTKIRGYDPATGKLLWTLGPNSEITVGTPVVGAGLVFVTGGYPPVRPIYAIKPTASGDISLEKGATSNEAIAWSNANSGTYIPTPIYYDGIFYTCNNDGVLTAYDARSGERIYRARVGGGGSFAASPIAADGRLYFANEDGDVIVAAAGRKYEELAKNPMKEVIMSTPAISDGTIIVRTLGHVYGIGQ